ncbi:MAG: YecR-like lipofamily protein [Deltaproteobacteria bacterium]|nr:YecR-like lipofamily protein [Deltaproteobacteria bacterium]
MKKSIVLCLALLLAVAAGCAMQRKVAKEWAATGGSRADATIELSYEYNPASEIPVLDEQQGLDLAIARCRSWGYRSAEPFGGIKRINNLQRYDPIIYGAIYSTLVTKQFQCLGRGSEVAK